MSQHLPVLQYCGAALFLALVVREFELQCKGEGGPVRGPLSSFTEEQAQLQTTYEGATSDSCASCETVPSSSTAGFFEVLRRLTCGLDMEPRTDNGMRDAPKHLGNALG